MLEDSVSEFCRVEQQLEWGSHVTSVSDVLNAFTGADLQIGWNFLF